MTATKTCSKCRETKPASLEYFAYAKTTKDKFYGWCRECANKRQRAYAAAHKEQLKAYRIANRQRIYGQVRAWVAAHKEHVAEMYRDWYEINKERKAARERERFENNGELYDRKRAQGREWGRSNRHLTRLYSRRRYATKRAAEGTHTPADISGQYEAQKGRCYYCNINVGDKYHVDHVIPLSRGGSNGPENLVIACPSCNMRKHDKMPHEWAQGGRLL
jgi:5-methylcytosine-specific restriction endonuclease McrA